MYVTQAIMLHTLNLYSVLYQLYLSKIERKKKESCILHLSDCIDGSDKGLNFSLCNEVSLLTAGNSTGAQ